MVSNLPTSPPTATAKKRPTAFLDGTRPRLLKPLKSGTVTRDTAVRVTPTRGTSTPRSTPKPLQPCTRILNPLQATSWSGPINTLSAVGQSTRCSSKSTPSPPRTRATWVSLTTQTLQIRSGTPTPAPTWSQQAKATPASPLRPTEGGLPPIWWTASTSARCARWIPTATAS